jgi:ketosteroid isomerase-like protein
MTFRETLEKHLDAIQARDLAALVETLPAPDERIVLLTAEGRLVRSVDEFVGMHRDWFASTTWTLGTEMVHAFESDDLGVAVLRLDYRDTGSEGTPIRQMSYLTLVFQRQGGRWVMVQDQNTPVKEPARPLTE